MDEENIPRGELTREEILRCAHELFLERGFNGASMRQIAQRAGIAVGGIYNHFASKEDIFEAIFLERHPFIELFPAMFAAQGDTLDAFVRDAAKHMVVALGEHYDFLNLMFIEIVEFKSKHIPKLFNKFFPYILEYSALFEKFQDRLRPIPPAVMMRAFLGLFFSYVMTQLMIFDMIPDAMQENALDYLVDIYLHGVIACDDPADGAKK
jgi:AcrR family transcriptional regulator